MNIRKKNIERIIITGNQKDAHKAFTYCEKNGFRITISGPMPISVGRVDVTRFKIVAEREVTND